MRTFLDKCREKRFMMDNKTVKLLSKRGSKGRRVHKLENFFRGKYSIKASIFRTKITSFFQIGSY